MIIDIQRLRNLTTGRLHTDLVHVYQDMETISGQQGLMTHMLPRMSRAIMPWLQTHVTDDRFWDGNYDTSRVGEYELPEPTVDERAEMVVRYQAQPNPLEGKNVVLVSRE